MTTTERHKLNRDAGLCPQMAAAVVRANWQDAAVWDIATLAELERRVAV